MDDRQPLNDVETALVRASTKLMLLVTLMIQLIPKERIDALQYPLTDTMEDMLKARDILQEKRVDNPGFDLTA